MPVERAVRELRGYGYKASQQRLALLKALAAEPHQNIVELRWRCLRIGLVTIYRNLKLFTELGLVRRLDLGDEPRYTLTRVI